MPARTASAVAMIALTLSGCGGAISRARPAGAARLNPSELAQLWIDPGPTPRDLYWGSGGRKHAPAPDAVYQLRSRDDTGFSVSYDVVGPDRMEWSAKIGPEAQTEVVVSRILWGLGYHQPPLYYLPSWTIDDRDGSRRESEARFRPKLPGFQRADEPWRWSDNPFLGAREFHGLLVVLLMLNSTDLKDENNSVYELTAPNEGASRWFLVRDLGAALGETGKLYPRRNWLEGFEKSGFIIGASGDTVEFDYDGRHRSLIATITPSDVRWAAERMHRLTDRQWAEAFRAANYADPAAQRFIRLIEQRIADGLSLTTSAE